ncbi:hypothetical protein [Carnimonas bestiolae]|uniref:hypothetical protein n=1 Tax=Carnimonas bestiolae TaxID=3402172 RepID=UPI003EDB7FDA
MSDVMADRMSDYMAEREEDVRSRKGMESAFPSNSEILGHCEGMLLRDWFAGQALQFAWMDINVEGNVKKTAESAYLVADAMMEARKK